MAKSTDKCSVRVAIRIRPQSISQNQDNLGVPITVALSQTQIALGEDKVFTFDRVFGDQAGQEEVFEQCVKELVEGTFDGYNATILAYGQTGSGKTFTMGTSFKRLSDEKIGIVPRAATHLLDGIEQRRVEAEENGEAVPLFEVFVQFIELYNEEIIDLLACGKSRAPIKIVEDLVKAEISVNGASNIAVKSVEEVMILLRKGVDNRTTMATNMNDYSSRSHAIFSVFVKQVREIQNDSDVVELDGTEPDKKFICSKLHFVDLAGSERLKKTGATGDRAKEGISINSGLLALGNVISILGAVSKCRPLHVPYRDSKLTRLLQDSLGGNSRTLMIACVSSNLANYAETLSTLQYANRAKNIKNRVVANQQNIAAKPKITKIPFTSRVNLKKISRVTIDPTKLFQQLPGCQVKGPNVTKTILRQREQLARLPRYAMHNSNITASSRFQSRSYGELNKQKIAELKAELERVNETVRFANSKITRLDRENSLLRQKVARLEAAGNTGRGLTSAFQVNSRQRYPIRAGVLSQKRHSRSMGGKPGPGGFYLPICILPVSKNSEVAR